MAWGIITSCTKESGYWKDPLFTELHLNDLGATVKALRDLLELPNDALMQRAAKGRVAIETKYNWERFCQTVWNELEPHVTA
jgi:glycosyltransferase involved in cell wall biosynthesis